MNSRSLLGLLARPSMVITLGGMAVITLGILFVQHNYMDAGDPRSTTYFQILYTALALIFLISFGGFLGRVTSELNEIRLCRTTPGLRHQINLSLLLSAPIVAGIVVGFMELTVPGYFRTTHPVTQWVVNIFFFSLGLGLGWSWLMVTVLTLIIAKLAFIIDHLHSAPLMSSAVALAGALVLLRIRYSRFLAPNERVPHSFLGLRWPATRSLEAPGIQRTSPSRDWLDHNPSIALSKLVKAGIYERFGHRRGSFLGRVGLSVASVQVLYGFWLYYASLNRSPSFGPFILRIFTEGKPDQMITILRLSFAGLLGGFAYVSSVTLDTTLAPNIWHPLSRRLLGKAVFISHLRQNSIFTAAHLSACVLFFLVLRAVSGIPIDHAALNALLTPALLAFILMPIAQAFFPNGADTFRRGANPLIQLFAGITGGLFCLLVIYWTAYWPSKYLHAQLSPEILSSLLAVFAVIVYTAYYAFLRRRYSRADFSPRV